MALNNSFSVLVCQAKVKSVLKQRLIQRALQFRVVLGQLQEHQAGQPFQEQIDLPHLREECPNWGPEVAHLQMELLPPAGAAVLVSVVAPGSDSHKTR